MLPTNPKNQLERHDQKRGYKETNIERRNPNRCNKEKEVKAIQPCL